MNAGSFRGNRYFVMRVAQGPNSWFVEAAENDVPASKPVGLDLHESLFSEEEIRAIHAAWSILDQKFEAEHARLEAALQVDGLVAAREKVHELVRAAEDARLAREVLELESLRIENEQIVKRAELEDVDAALAAKRAAAEAAAVERSQHAAAVEAMQSEVARLEAMRTAIVDAIRSHAEAAAEPKETPT